MNEFNMGQDGSLGFRTNLMRLPCQGAVHALNSLRTIGRALHAWVIPEQASIAEAEKVFDASGILNDCDLEKRVKQVGRQVARFAYLHTSEKAQEFLRAWEGAPLNPGG